MMSLLLLACVLGKAGVNQLIEDARHCTGAEDCVLLPNHSCEFGCWIAVNDAEQADVQQAIDDYDAAKKDICMLSCPPEPDLDCLSNKCVAVYHVD
jgi:hypothetical protein